MPAIFRAVNYEWGSVREVVKSGIGCPDAVGNAVKYLNFLFGHFVHWANF